MKKVSIIFISVFISSFISSQGNSDLEELVVSGIFIPDEKRSTSEISNLISSSEMSEAGDSNIADALKRVTGLSLVKGKYVYVRGLGDRYSSALLDGSSIASPEPLSRVVPLDLFPTNVLESVLVQKTYSPEFPGNFGGGIVNLRTIAVPEEEFLDFSFSLGGDNLTTSKSFLSSPNYDSDVYGFGSSERALPKEYLSAVSAGKIIRRNNSFFSGGLNPSELQIIGSELASNMPKKLKLSSLDPNISLSLSTGNSFEINDSDMGIIFALNYSNEWDSQEKKRNSNSWQPEASNPDDILVVVDKEEFTNSTNTINLSSIFGLGFEIDDDHTIKLTSFLTRKSSDTVSFIYSDLALSNFPMERTYVEWVERQVWTNQASGEHFWGDLQLNWRTSYAESTRESPNNLDTQYEVYEDGTRYFGNRNDKFRLKFFDLQDSVVDLGADFKYFIVAGDVSMDFKIGASYYFKDRDNQISNFEFDPSPTATIDFNESFLTLPLNQLFADEYISPDAWEINEIAGAADYYGADSEIFAFYSGIDGQFKDSLRISFGFRYEDSDINVKNFNKYSKIQNDRSDLALQKVLPSVTLTQMLDNNMQIRFALSETVVRPNFRELAQSVFFNPATNRSFVGNPDLKITEITNLDFRYEWYFGNGGQYFSAGLFAKDLKNPIEQGIQPGTFYREFLNVDEGQMLGTEFEVYYDFFPYFIRSNLTFMNSEVDTTSQFVQAKRSLQGQSDFLGNFTFGYETGDHKVVLAYNYTGERISELAPIKGAPAYYEQGTGILDLNYTAFISSGDNDLEIGFSIGNLTGENYQVYQLDELVEVYDYPITYSFSIKAVF